MSLYPLPCSRTKLSCRNILLGKKFRVKNCGPAEQWTVRHCMGNRVKALELLYGSQDLVFNKLGLEVPGSWSSPVKNLTTDSIKRKFGFALGNCFLQRQPGLMSVGTLGPNWGTQEELCLVIFGLSLPGASQHPGCLTVVGQVAVPLSISRFAVKECNVLERALHGSQEAWAPVTAPTSLCYR